MFYSHFGILIFGKL